MYKILQSLHVEKFVDQIKYESHGYFIHIFSNFCFKNCKNVHSYFNRLIYFNLPDKVAAEI